MCVLSELDIDIFGVVSNLSRCWQKITKIMASQHSDNVDNVKLFSIFATCRCKLLITVKTVKVQGTFLIPERGEY